MPKNTFHYRRSIFWPVLLIGIGAVLLLSNMNIIEPVNFYFLLQLWPVLLISAGVQILLGKNNPWVGNVLAVIVVGVAIGFMVYVPDLGIELPSYTNVEYLTTNYSEPIDDSESAGIYLDMDSGDLEIIALPSGNNLVEAEVTFSGEVDFIISGNAERKHVSLELDDLNSFNFGFQNWISNEQNSAIVELSPNLPLSIEVDLSSGSAVLNLAGLEITELDADNGSGNLTVVFASGSYPTNLNTGSGSLIITSEDGVVFDLEADVGSGRIILDLVEEVSGYLDLSSGSGSITINVPETLGVRVNGSTGSGNISVPSSFVKTRGSDSIGPSEDGTWESANYLTADYQVVFDVSVGSGNLRINFN